MCDDGMAFSSQADYVRWRRTPSALIQLVRQLEFDEYRSMVTPPPHIRRVDYPRGDRDHAGTGEDAVDAAPRVLRAVGEAVPLTDRRPDVESVLRQLGPGGGSGHIVDVAGDDGSACRRAPFRSAPGPARRRGEHEVRPPGRGASQPRRTSSPSQRRTASAAPRWCRRRSLVNNTSRVAMTSTSRDDRMRLAAAVRPPVTTTKPDRRASAAHLERQRNSRGASWMQTTCGCTERITRATAPASSRSDRTL